MTNRYKIEQEFRVCVDAIVTLPDGMTWDDIRDFKISADTLVFATKDGLTRSVPLNSPRPDHPMSPREAEVFRVDEFGELIDDEPIGVFVRMP